MKYPLSDKALAVIAAYENMPYYNNKRQNVRMGVRARIGKGSADEILEEARAYALQEKVDWHALSPEMQKKFLVDHHLGVDCSAFAYYVLDAESEARGKGPLSKLLLFPFATSFLSRLARVLRNRTVENADVRTFAHPANSREVTLGDIRPGDFLARIVTDDSKERNHIMIVSAVSSDENAPGEIEVSQAAALPTDGKYGHGVRTEILPREALANWSLRRLNSF